MLPPVDIIAPPAMVSKGDDDLEYGRKRLLPSIY